MNNLKPFSLPEALAGKAVMLRDGRKAYVRHYETELAVESNREVFGYAENGDSMTWGANGRSLLNGELYTDIVGMYPETRIINGFEVPAPEIEAPELGAAYYLPEPTRRCFHSCESWVGDSVDKVWLERGLVFLNKEDAIATAKAMLGIDPKCED